MLLRPQCSPAARCLLIDAATPTRLVHMRVLPVLAVSIDRTKDEHRHSELQESRVCVGLSAETPRHTCCEPSKGGATSRPAQYMGAPCPYPTPTVH